jgi:hypothetical protein
MKTFKPLHILGVILVLLLGAPLLFSRFGATCSLDKVNAQDNPCLAQEATISVLNGGLLQATIDTINYQATTTALHNTINTLSTNSAPVVHIVTFVVVITATPNLEPTLVLPQATMTSDDILPEGCIRHTLQAGDSPSILGDIYGVSFLDILAVNNLTEEDVPYLQIGEVLIIPLENCPKDIFTNTQPMPQPTAPNLGLQMEIVEITGMGDITREQVVIRNNGNIVDMSGWTLSDGQGNIFTFPNDRRLFSGASVTLNTRVGTDTPTTFFWGQDVSVFESGDVVTLKNQNGEVVVSLILP